MPARKHRTNLTVAGIDKLAAAPPGERVELQDGGVHGLVLRVTDRGVKTFSFVYRKDTKHRRKTLNRWPEEPTAQKDALAEARARAKQLAADVARGRDPVQEEKDAEAAATAELARRPPTQTLQWLADQFIELEARPSIKTWAALKRTLEIHWLPVLGDTPIHEIRRQHIYDVLDRLVKEKRPGAAGEARKVISRVFNWALVRGYLDNVPSTRLKIGALDRKGKPPAHRELTDAEIAAVYNGAASLDEPFRQLARVIQLTGGRRSEIAETRWPEITKDRWLEIPAARYKTGRDHTIYLAPPAWAEVQILRLRNYDSIAQFVFTARGGTAPIRGWTWLDDWREAALRAAGEGETVGHWSPHDLRVTCRTRLAKLGISGEIAEAVIGHAKPGIVATYNKHDYREQKRAALEEYAKHVLELAGEAHAKRAV